VEVGHAVGALHVLNLQPDLTESLVLVRVQVGQSGGVSAPCALQSGNRIAVIGTAAMDREASEASWSLAIARAKTMAGALAAAGYAQPVTVLGRGGAATDVAAALGRLEIMIMPERTTP